MLVEPTLERAAVAEALKREYGRAVSAIQFVPVGESAWCYSATDDRGARWFIKLARPGELVPARVEFAVAVSQALADLGLPVPRPLPTLAGALWSSLNGPQMTVVEFVAGTPLSDEELRSPEVHERIYAPYGLRQNHPGQLHRTRPRPDRRADPLRRPVAGGRACSSRGAARPDRPARHHHGELPPPAEHWRTPAGGDRPGADAPAAATARRRGRVPIGRLDAVEDPQPAPRHPRRARRDGRLHHPRPLRSPPGRRPGGGHVPGTADGDLRGRPLLLPPDPPLQPRVDGLHSPVPRHPYQRPHPPRRDPEPSPPPPAARSSPGAPK